MPGGTGEGGRGKNSQDGEQKGRAGHAEEKQGEAPVLCSDESVGKDLFLVSQICCYILPGIN